MYMSNSYVGGKSPCIAEMHDLLSQQVQYIIEVTYKAMPLALRM